MALLSLLTVPLLSQTNSIWWSGTGNTINVWNISTGGVCSVSWTNIWPKCAGPDLSGTNNFKFYPSVIIKTKN